MYARIKPRLNIVQIVKPRLEPPLPHPRGNPGANLQSLSNRCHPILVAFAWDLTKTTINLPLGCLQGGLLLNRRLLQVLVCEVAEREGG